MYFHIVSWQIGAELVRRVGIDIRETGSSRQIIDCKEINTVNHYLSCEYNIDTACVELKFADGRMIAVDCKAVETALDADTWQRSELDWLIYNKPLEYVQVVFSGEIEEYVKGTAEHRLMD